MTEAEALVLLVAAILVVAVFVERTKGTIAVPVGALLLTFAMLAAVAALVHVVAW